MLANYYNNDVVGNRGDRGGWSSYSWYPRFNNPIDDTSSPTSVLNPPPASNLGDNVPSGGSGFVPMPTPAPASPAQVPPIASTPPPATPIGGTDNFIGNLTSGGLPIRPQMSQMNFGSRTVRPTSNTPQNRGDVNWRQNLSTFAGGDYGPTDLNFGGNTEDLAAGGNTYLNPLSNQPFGQAGPPPTMLDMAMTAASPYDPFSASLNNDYLNGLNPLGSLFGGTSATGTAAPGTIPAGATSFLTGYGPFPSDAASQQYLYQYFGLTPAGTPASTGSNLSGGTNLPNAPFLASTGI